MGQACLGSALQPLLKLRQQVECYLYNAAFRQACLCTQEQWLDVAGGIGLAAACERCCITCVLLMQLVSMTLHHHKCHACSLHSTQCQGHAAAFCVEGAHAASTGAEQQLSCATLLGPHTQSKQCSIWASDLGVECRAHGGGASGHARGAGSQGQPSGGGPVCLPWPFLPVRLGLAASLQVMVPYHSLCIGFTNLAANSSWQMLSQQQCCIDACLSPVSKHVGDVRCRLRPVRGHWPRATGHEQHSTVAVCIASG